MKSINEIKNQVESIYKTLNEWVSEGTTPLLDSAFPEHDGVADIDVISDMMLLRQSLNSLSKACEIGADHLTNVIVLTEQDN